MRDEEERTAENTALSLELVLLIIGGFLAGAAVMFFLGEEDPIRAIATAAGAVMILTLLSALLWGLYLRLRA